ncbi:hypothetical protein A5871_001266 [Enterococcus sp. 2F9_DIV0599]|uniref:hypothetical protein n=1 Tax=Enterococcus sp. 2F9_DIV0599 TaxID=1834172 RepID=UPI000A32E6DC|nr:hypothetical protein [Enterococcus sp. 2F9_DIV0599]OTO36712.1 hypothetical protein A5871_001266 [Enterococcus sp. 2F9_DIV0599]
MKKRNLLTVCNERRSVNQQKLNYAEEFLLFRGNTQEELYSDKTFLTLIDKEKELVQERDKLLNLSLIHI